MLELKIFVWVQTFRRRPFAPSHNFCPPCIRSHPILILKFWPGSLINLHLENKLVNETDWWLMIPTIMITIILAITIIMRITCIILSLGIERRTLIDGTLRLTYSVVHTPLSVILLHHYHHHHHHHHHSAHPSICISFFILIISIFKILNILSS